MIKKNNWAYSWEKPRLWIIDARAFLILLAAALYWSWWLLGLCVSVIAVLFYIERRKKMSIEAALRFIICAAVTFIQGRRRPVCPLATRNFFIDIHDLEILEPDRHFVLADPDVFDIVEYSQAKDTPAKKARPTPSRKINTRKN